MRLWFTSCLVCGARTASAEALCPACHLAPQPVPVVQGKERQIQQQKNRGPAR